MKYLYAGAANLLACALLPCLLLQGKHTRRVTPRLPEASGARHGCAVSPQAQRPGLKLLAIGESPVAGVGVATQHEAITSRFAQQLAQQHRCNVAWQALGQNGATVFDAIEQLLPQVPATPQDIVLIAFGVNDTSRFRSIARFQRDLQHLTEQLLRRCKPRLLLLAGVPPVGRLPALPQPLRLVLGLKAQSLHHAAYGVLQELQKKGHDNAIYAPLEIDLQDAELIASDGYHPSGKGADVWAQGLARLVAAQLQGV